jgi:hypothetical protein
MSLTEFSAAGRLRRDSEFQSFDFMFMACFHSFPDLASLTV